MSSPQEVLARFESTSNELSEFLGAIDAEIKEFNDLSKNNKSRIIDSLRCRVLFSLIESYISHLKQSAILFSLDQPGLFSRETIMALQDNEPFVTNKGEVITKRAKIKMKDNMRLAFKSVAKAVNSGHQLDLSGKGFQSFEKSIKIRDRLTHPKSSSDLFVTEKESEEIINAWLWFTEQLKEVIKSPAGDS